MPGGDDDDIIEDEEGIFSDDQDIIDPLPPMGVNMNDNLNDISEAHLESVIDQNHQIDHSRQVTNITTKSTNQMQKSKGSIAQQRQLQKEEKFLALYDDAKHRILRKEHIYSNCIDQECTFKPRLITQHSKVSKSTVKEVQRVVRDKSRHMAEALANKENIEVAADHSVNIIRNSSSGNLRRNDKPAVASVPPQEFLTNSRLTYLTNRDAKSKDN